MAVAASPPVPGGSTPMVRFEAVTHRYGDHVALDGFDLSIPGGETVALLGPNGAGKSTMISLLLGLTHVQSGTIEVLGRSPRSAVRDGQVGAMLQTGSGAGLPPGVRVSAALAMVARLYPRPAPLAVTVQRAGIARLLDRQTQRLSGGQAQLVRFAVAIAGDPALVVLDEPTAALDVAGQRAFWRMIRQFGHEGRTTIFATHHLREADEIADRVVVVHHGRVVADGPGAALRAKVAARKLRFVCDRPDPGVLDGLEGVTDVEVRGVHVRLDTLDSDATVRALVGHAVAFRDLEVSGADLEEAFLALTQRPPAAAGGDRS